MPKQKTHKGIAKRVKTTANGKLKHHKGFHSHILTKKSGNRKRQLRKAKLLSKSYQKRYKKLLHG
ncbi:MULTISPECIES: 50S ribosomal protein L35 [Halanaerobium]|jgi:large subunit ribosomal protein L35|uniref:Large ribosomal subunit protein bL35 n=1 Tax=Halanaerobium kushneri TaxID=56779 RepID=A0A1N7BRP8_9FIRM|nr:MULTISPECIES: 50S ribosomal protein L35 [Halanaerobium]RCW61231.1 LSU ribosomal protein L35P [Halanaerobium sp. ST460_2HS_T2]SIR53995.1 LSU ribosomal protein L35P [Halanaerobium kushneri]